MSINPLPILAAAGAYWLLGALWYSVLFGGIWAKGLEKHGIKISPPSGGKMAVMMGLTFLGNLLAAAAVGFLIIALNPESLLDALLLGAVAGVGFAAGGLGIAYTWESKPLSVFAVDAGYQVLGIMLAALIQGLWRPVT